MKQVIIYTDGACSGNPGRGGYAAVLVYNDHKRELSAGYQLTTNNRMELMAAISALSALKEPCQVTLYSDSQYLVNAMQLGWAKRWKANGWKRNRKQKATNTDLLDKLLELCAFHHVEFVWIPRNSHELAKLCDKLAGNALNQPELLPDTGYEEIDLV